MSSSPRRLRAARRARRSASRSVVRRPRRAGRRRRFRPASAAPPGAISRATTPSAVCAQSTPSSASCHVARERRLASASATQHDRDTAIGSTRRAIDASVGPELVKRPASIRGSYPGCDGSKVRSSGDVEECDFSLLVSDLRPRALVARGSIESNHKDTRFKKTDPRSPRSGSRIDGSQEPRVSVVWTAPAGESRRFAGAEPAVSNPRGSCGSDRSSELDGDAARRPAWGGGRRGARRRATTPSLGSRNRLRTANTSSQRALPVNEERQSLVELDVEADLGARRRFVELVVRVARS